MARVVLALFVAVAIFAISAQAEQQCGENEEYVTCGTFCEPTCQVPRAESCTYQCKIGCQCLDGYLRNDAGVCVSAAQCNH